MFMINPVISLGQNNGTDNSKKAFQLKVPSHLDIESQSLEQEMAYVKNLTPTLNYTNNTGINPNQTNTQ